MMQTRPSLMLRKPASPSPEAIAAFIENSEPSAPTFTDAVAPLQVPHLHAVPAVNEVQQSPEAVQIAKPRKPRAASAEEMPVRTEAPSFRRPSRAVVERRTGPSRRRTTIYLDLDIAAQLSAVLVERDQELSDAVNAAVAAWLRTVAKSAR
jgi:hypothetical protein